MFYYVYFLESIKYPNYYYVESTVDLKRRLEKPNQGGSPHTSKLKPWRITMAVSFTDKHKAYAFEKYLKSHSGRAFSKKHF